MRKVSAKLWTSEVFIDHGTLVSLATGGALDWRKDAGASDLTLLHLATRPEALVSRIRAVAQVGPAEGSMESSSVRAFAGMHSQYAAARLSKGRGVHSRSFFVPNALITFRPGSSYTR